MKRSKSRSRQRANQASCEARKQKHSCVRRKRLKLEPQELFIEQDTDLLLENKWYKWNLIKQILECRVKKSLF